MKEELEGFGLKVRHSDDPDSEPIDEVIYDGEDEVAFVYGSEPFKDVQVECDHPNQCIDFGDGEEQGECLLCGATCDYHYEMDDDHEVPTPHMWHEPEQIGGIIGDYLKDLQKRW